MLAAYAQPDEIVGHRGQLTPGFTLLFVCGDRWNGSDAFNAP